MTRRFGGLRQLKERRFAYEGDVTTRINLGIGSRRSPVVDSRRWYPRNDSSPNASPLASGSLQLCLLPLVWAPGSLLNRIRLDHSDLRLRSPCGWASGESAAIERATLAASILPPKPAVRIIKATPRLTLNPPSRCHKTNGMRRRCRSRFPAARQRPRSRCTCCGTGGGGRDPGSSSSLRKYRRNL